MGLTLCLGYRPGHLGWFGSRDLVFRSHDMFLEQKSMIMRYVFFGKVPSCGMFFFPRKRAFAICFFRKSATALYVFFPRKCAFAICFFQKSATALYVFFPKKCAFAICFCFRKSTTIHVSKQYTVIRYRNPDNPVYLVSTPEKLVTDLVPSEIACFDN